MASMLVQRRRQVAGQCRYGQHTTNVRRVLLRMEILTKRGDETFLSIRACSTHCRTCGFRLRRLRLSRVSVVLSICVLHGHVDLACHSYVLHQDKMAQTRESRFISRYPPIFSSVAAKLLVTDSDAIRDLRSLKVDCLLQRQTVFAIFTRTPYVMTCSLMFRLSCFCTLV
jgi:hypothetical protein